MHSIAVCVHALESFVFALARCVRITLRADRGHRGSRTASARISLRSPAEQTSHAPALRRSLARAIVCEALKSSGVPHKEVGKILGNLFEDDPNPHNKLHP